MILMLVRRYVCLSRQATVRGDELSGVTVCVSIFLTNSPVTILHEL